MDIEEFKDESTNQETNHTDSRSSSKENTLPLTHLKMSKEDMIFLEEDTRK